MNNNPPASEGRRATRVPQASASDKKGAAQEEKGENGKVYSAPAGNKDFQEPTVNHQFQSYQIKNDKTRFMWVIKASWLSSCFEKDELFQLQQTFRSQNDMKWKIKISRGDNETTIKTFPDLSEKELEEPQWRRSTTIILQIYYLDRNLDFQDKCPKSQSFTFTADKFEHVISFQDKEVQFHQINIGPIYIEGNFTINKTYSGNSKQEVGYVGLVNQGSTCYMNSFLQTMFNLPYFVRCLFELKSDQKMNLKLQQLFYHMMKSDKAVDTKELVEGFGWDRTDNYIQQDVQEFQCMFFDALQRILSEDSNIKHRFNEMIKGEMMHQIQCVDADIKQKNSETFYDIQLNVKDCRHILQSLNYFTHEEELSDQYDTGDPKYGKQKAMKKIFFSKLPHVFFFHLQRVEYDASKERNIKIMDRYQYFETIDMRNYMEENLLKEDYTYKLYAIMVHSGEHSGSGHYYVYVCPRDNVWLKFNDSCVESVLKTQAFQANFGGTVEHQFFEPKKRKLVEESSNSSTTAYMLVYVRRTKWDEIMASISDEEIPNWVKVEEERKNKENSEKDRKSKLVDVKITDFENLKTMTNKATGIVFHKTTSNDEECVVDQKWLLNVSVNSSYKFYQFHSELINTHLQAQYHPHSLLLVLITFNKDREDIINLTKYASEGKRDIDFSQIYKGSSRTNKSMTKSPILLLLSLNKNHIQFIKPIEKKANGSKFSSQKKPNNSKMYPEIMQILEQEQIPVSQNENSVMEIDSEEPDEENFNEFIIDSAIKKPEPKKQESESIAVEEEEEKSGENLCEYSEDYRRVMDEEATVIFVKMYSWDPKLNESSLHIIYYDIFPVDITIGKLKANLQSTAEKMTRNCLLEFYFQNGMEINNFSEYEQSKELLELVNASSNVFLEVIIEQQGVGFDKKSNYKDVREYFSSISNSISVTFTDKTRNFSFKSVMNKSYDYFQITEEIAKKGFPEPVDREKISIRAQKRKNQRAELTDIPYPKDDKLENLDDLTQCESIIYYSYNESLNTKDKDSKDVIEVKYYWTDINSAKNYQEEDYLKVVCDQQVTIKQIITQIKEQKMFNDRIIQDGFDVEKDFFVLAQLEDDYKITKYFLDEAQPFQQQDQKDQRAQFRLEVWKERPQDDDVIIICHHQTQSNTLFEVPFSIIVTQFQTLKDLRKIIYQQIKGQYQSFMNQQLTERDVDPQYTQLFFIPSENNSKSILIEDVDELIDTFCQAELEDQNICLQVEIQFLNISAPQNIRKIDTDS